MNYVLVVVERSTKNVVFKKISQQSLQEIKYYMQKVYMKIWKIKYMNMQDHQVSMEIE